VAAGEPTKLTGDKPNVQLLLSGDQLRQHPQGADFGRLLGAIPEWASFFEGTGIDPVRDFDHLLLAGPQFRDFRQVVAVMDYHAETSSIQAAMESLRGRAGGTWVKGAASPTLRFRSALDGAERFLVHVPKRKLLALVPLSAEGQLQKVQGIQPFSASSSALVLSLVEPARALRGLPLALPPSISSLRLRVLPTAEGGLSLELELQDKELAEAKAHADKLTQDVAGLRMLLAMATPISLPPIPFRAEGSVIRGKAELRSDQLRVLVPRVQSWLPSPGGGRAPRALPPP
jgi:hypothetical protein